MNDFDFPFWKKEQEEKKLKGNSLVERLEKEIAYRDLARTNYKWNPSWDRAEAEYNYLTQLLQDALDQIRRQ